MTIQFFTGMDFSIGMVLCENYAADIFDFRQTLIKQKLQDTPVIYSCIGFLQFVSIICLFYHDFKKEKVCKLKMKAYCFMNENHRVVKIYLSCHYNASKNCNCIGGVMVRVW